MGDQLELATDAGSGVGMRRSWIEAPAESKHGRERAEVEILRAELLNDPHTLLLLPCIRERIYTMSFTDSLVIDGHTQLFFHLQKMNGVSEENMFRMCDEFLNIAKSLSLVRWNLVQRCVKDTTFCYLVGLDILLQKLAVTYNFSEILHRAMSSRAVTSDLTLDYSFAFDWKNFCHIYSFPIFESDSYSEESTSYATVVAKVLVLLFCVCQYLVLFVDRGRGSRSYSSGSLDFRDVYISIVLFRGAYIWIKFRQAATSQTSLKRKFCEAQDHVPGVYCKSVKNKSGSITHYKYEPRFKPRREKLDSGATLQFSRLSLGEYDTPGEAKIVLQIAAFYYGAKDDAGDRVKLEDGSFFVIPAMDEHEKRLTGLSKAKWVTDRAKKLFKELQPESAVKSRRQSRTSNAAVGLDVADPVGSGHEPVLEPEFWGVQHNAPEMGNDALEPHRHGNSSACDGEAPMSAYDQLMFDELRFGSATISSQAQSFPGLGVVSEILGDASPPQSGNGAAQEFVGIPNPNCGQGVESLGTVHDECTVTNVSERFTERDHQPLVSRQKELLEKYAIRVADLEHQLLGSEVKKSELEWEVERLRAGQRQADVSNSELRREIELLRAGKRQADVSNSELRREIEHLRAAKAQEAAAAAKSQVGTWLADFVIDFPSEEGR